MRRLNNLRSLGAGTQRFKFALLALLATACALPAFIAHAANPAAGTLNPTTGAQLTWTGTATGSQTGVNTQEADCVEGVTCDTYTVTVSGNPADWAGKTVHVQIDWTNITNDYDLYVHKGSNSGPEVNHSAGVANTSEGFDFSPNDPAVGTGVFTVHVVYSTVGAAATDQYHGSLKVNATAAPTPTPPPAPVGTGQAPRFQIFTPTADVLAKTSNNGTDAGEPSIGANWKTGAAMYISRLTTFRVTFDDSCPTSPTATWTEHNAPNNANTLDPILYTDHGYDNVNPTVGRTFASQLSGTTSLMEYTDDDGNNWTPTQGGSLMSGVDHQTVGGGPFHAPAPVGVVYPNAIYYCSQDIGAANCSLSLNGGLTFGPAVPIYGVNDCTGLHGHVKVAPDGTVYLPNRGCGGSLPFHAGGYQAVIVSEDNGLTWTQRPIPNSQAASGDPAVAIGKGGKLYFGYANADLHPAVAVSDDQGRSWHDIKDVGAAAGINNVDFPALVAGDNDRAALAFLGSTTAGNGGDRKFPGLWHLYVATTYDGGVSWQTVDVTPTDPVQRWGIHRGGGSPVHRNLLDFIGIDVDKQGRILVGYADGCTGAACVQAANSTTGNAYSQEAAIARQTGGRRLFAGSDPTSATIPGAPYLTVGRDGNAAHLSWSQSDDGGAPVTNYRITRRPAGGTETTLTSAGTATRYDDTTAAVGTTYFYRVIATNALGDSCGNNEVAAKPQGDSCNGLTEVFDGTGDQTSAPANADLDIQTVAASDEVVGGAQKITFKLKVADLNTIVPNRQWRVLWYYPQAPAPPTPNATPAPFTGQYYVGLNSDGGQLTYEYGTVTTEEAVPADLAQPNKIGAADGGSVNQQTGVISITIAASKVGGPKAGDVLGRLIARTFAGNGNQTLRSNAAVDTTGNAMQDPYTGLSYLVAGNTACTAATPTPTPTPTATPTPAPTPPGPEPSTVQFSQPTYVVNEDAKNVTVTVTRLGSTLTPATVEFATSDSTAAIRCDVAGGQANQRCDYTTAVGTLTFAAGETAQAFSIFITDDNHVEGNETFTVALRNQTGTSFGVPNTTTVTILDNDSVASNNNPIDGHEFFVRRHYVDFHYREPEQAGMNAWVNVLRNCADVNNADPNAPSAQCDRTIVSSSFFRSQEFQIKGYFVYRFYRVAFARRPSYQEFIRDLRRVTGATADEVNASKAAYTQEFRNRDDFRSRYDTQSDSAYVDMLQANVGVQVSNQQQLKDDLAAGRTTRADVLRAIVESSEVDAKEYNGGFVATEYFGYLRRDPETGGFNAWLDYLNTHPGDYRTMVSGFVNSLEYRLRFGKQ
jgi:hypothetical protein